MNLFLRKIVYCLLLTFGLSGIVFGQFTSTSADAVIPTAYSTTDKIFVFYQTPANKLGSLTALVPDTSKADIVWSQYDTLSKDFKTPFKNRIGVHSDTVNNLKEGGYRVQITHPGIDTTFFMAWITFDTLSIKVDKDNDGFVPYFRSTCDYFDLITTYTSKPVKYRYIDPKTKKAYIFQNKVTFQWSATSANSEVFATDSIDNRTRVEGKDIPSKNTPYYVKATDKFGLVCTDMVTYKSIVTKALFEAVPEQFDGQNSAPLVVHFTNNSENGNKFTWYMGDGDTLQNNNTTFDHTYYTPDSSFNVKLISESKDLCVDTISKPLSVAFPTLTMPNAFVPRGDNTFKFKDGLSLQYWRITIFTRLGKKIFEETGHDNANPKGWNGKIGNSLASEGIYFYTIEIRHWDPHPKNIILPTGQHSGFFYLFRPN
jgi:hypothetical protein